jgi:uroporphyrinogen decarboxylase
MSVILQPNERFLRTIWREPVDATPVWIMRQAGRYLPEYRAVREQAGSFMTLCKTPELACEVTLQPLRRFALDASIIFSDILTIPDAMGLGLSFIEGQGPRFAHPVRNAHDIQKLGVPDPEVELRYVLDAIRMVQQHLAGRLPLIGFCGSPWTVGCYMVEGQSRSDFALIQGLRKENPRLLHQLLAVLSHAISDHLNAQIKAGVQAVMIFDTWGGILDKESYLEFSLNYVKEIISRLLKSYNNKRIPVILFTKGGGSFLAEMATTGCHVLGVDQGMTLAKARETVGQQVTLQGNMNPDDLLQTPENIRETVKSVLASYGSGSGHVFNLGHGITPNVPPENVAVLVDAVHEFSKPYHVKGGYL